MLAVGAVAYCAPDGSPLARQLAAGTKLCCHAVLMQCRGDWPFLKQLFCFPAYNEIQARDGGRGREVGGLDGEAVEGRCRLARLIPAGHVLEVLRRFL